MGFNVKLHLGVYDAPHEEGNTVYQVAKDLERRYEIIGNFADAYLPGIADHLAMGLQNALGAIVDNGHFAPDPFASGCAAIDQQFKTFLDRESMAIFSPLVPTDAALKGWSSRLKKFTGVRRPSFIDTGLYRANFHSWVDQPGAINADSAE